MFDKLKEKIAPKSDAKKDGEEEVKLPLHPNTVKTLEDQEIKRKALAKSRPYVEEKSDVVPTTAGYSQNLTNGSIQPDGQLPTNKLDSDDPDFETFEKQKEKAAEQKAERKEKEAKEKEAKEKEKAEKEEAKKSKK